MEQGTICRWDEERAFGFIAPDFGGADIFLHVRAFDGRVSVAEGDRVEFKVGIRERGPYALEAALCSEVN